MARYKMIISYDGTDFCGWQRQKAHKHASPKPSLQETFEIALGKILNHPVDISASGRTDAGVHALQQVCHFDTERTLPKDLCWALKSQLPLTMSAKSVEQVPDNFHATLWAVRKTYRYWIWNHPRAPALLGRFSWWLRSPLNLDKLNEISKPLLGEKDFASFRTMGTELKTTVRRIEKVQWTERRPGLLEFRITGNGFMKQMVRNIVGTITDLESEGFGPDKMSEIIGLCDRRKAGTTAPPQGLFLYNVEYPKES
jgi:tRNA pseudouridine38-40 synthase